jgi:hypothetical protein
MPDGAFSTSRPRRFPGVDCVQYQGGDDEKRSVMFFLALDGPVSLNATDLVILAGHYQLPAAEPEVRALNSPR